MRDDGTAATILARTEAYLTGALLPFWMDRSPDTEYGGFLTYFGADGRPTGETVKTFLMQIRMLYTMASAHRAGYGGGRCGELARMGAEFILEHYWDDEHEGWIWIADREGRPIFRGKVGYGQAFAVYAFSEYALATGDARGREAAERTWRAICAHMADTRYGGYHEIMGTDWQPAPAGRAGGDRKSLDVHMHLMEALTTLYELTGHPSHRRRLEEVMGLLLGRMLHPEHAAGYMQFADDLTPLPAIQFEVEWGSDKPPEDGVARPVDYTSYGHNAELAWLLLHAGEVLGYPPDRVARPALRIMEHCLAYGVDPVYGGVYVEGPMVGPPGDDDKQFWQQAEVLVALLDAYRISGDERYWRAFVATDSFVHQRLVNLAAGGEWIARAARDGSPIWGYLGHAWKISYHTVRSTIQVVARLRGLLAAGGRRGEGPPGDDVATAGAATVP